MSFSGKKMRNKMQQWNNGWREQQEQMRAEQEHMRAEGQRMREENIEQYRQGTMIGPCRKLLKPKDMAEQGFTAFFLRE
jgi:hypothetical protein